MPVPTQVALDFHFKDLIPFIKSWEKNAFGQTAISIGVPLSSNCLIGGGVSSSENSFLFPLSTALNGHILLNEQCRRPDAISF